MQDWHNLIQYFYQNNKNIQWYSFFDKEHTNIGKYAKIDDNLLWNNINI